VPVRDSVAVSVREPVIVPVFDVVAFVREPVIVPADAAEQIEKVRIATKAVVLSPFILFLLGELCRLLGCWLDGAVT